MDLLPQVSSEDLDERDLQCGDLAMHEDPCEVQLYLKAHVDLAGEGYFSFQDTIKDREHPLPYLPITLTLARLMVGDHQRVNRRLGI